MSEILEKTNPILWKIQHFPTIVKSLQNNTPCSSVTRTFYVGSSLADPSNSKNIFYDKLPFIELEASLTLGRQETGGNDRNLVLEVKFGNPASIFSISKQNNYDTIRAKFIKVSLETSQSTVIDCGSQTSVDLNTSKVQLELFDSNEVHSYVTKDQTITFRMELEAILVLKPSTERKTLYDRMHIAFLVLRDFGKMLMSSDFSDFKIKSNGKFLTCHKCILAARSPVFERMLNTNNSLEVLEGAIEIQNVSSPAVECFLSFLYTGQFGESEATWIPLLPELANLANRYMIPELKNYCDMNFVRCVTPDNFVSSHTYADNLELQTAKQDLLKFAIASNDVLQFLLNKEQIQNLKRLGYTVGEITIQK